VVGRLREVCGCTSAVRSGVDRVLRAKVGVRIWGSEPDPLIRFSDFGGPRQTPYSVFSNLGVRARPPNSIFRLWGSEPDPLVWDPNWGAPKRSQELQQSMEPRMSGQREKKGRFEMYGTPGEGYRAGCEEVVSSYVALVRGDQSVEATVSAS
jgi:hypothetical protein